ncbi:hypothetical protein PHISCL_06036 [Aspergillus sclerotialis]|uniref:Protein phosphatase 4 core regulatory subunit R2 n=1 Tax=Aspergillus sclerotialis TaxID=2070753 RepID=A0A3A2ZG89_9EURO|nr:hypothetical protein PHISCL_06036 [Aspergillus sclerotialis]
MPKMPREAPPPFSLHNQPSSYTSSQLQDPNSVPSSSNKENAFPADLQTPPRPTAPTAAATSSIERVPDSQPQSSAPGHEPLPAPLMLLLNSIHSTIKSYFTSKPPHTIQRLAELILRPNSHYRTLPAYLRAIDRVVSVTSSADIFPTQMQASANQPNGVMNGAGGGLDISDHIHGDESLGGALLTPIPWLSNATSFEDDSTTSLNQGLVGDHETVTSIPAHHQQHLHQQEVETVAAAQHPVSHGHATTPHTAAEGETLRDPTSPPSDTSEEVPHARGPPVVGVEDMGLQDGKGVEMPLASVEDGSSSEQPKHGEQASSESRGADNDGDITLGDFKNGEGSSEGQRTAEADTSKATEKGD